MTQADVVYPTPFQLALATVIHENKPAASSVRDYIASLRARICNTTSTPPYQQETYVDGVEYWKARCEQLEEEKLTLSAELTEVRAKSGTLCTASAKKPRNTSQRKRKTSIPRSATDLGAGSTKRARTDQRGTMIAPDILPETDVTANDPKGSKQRFVTLLFRINRLLRPDLSSDQTDLAFNISSACQQLSRIIENCCGRVVDVITSELTLPVGRTLAALLQASGRLRCEAEDGDRKNRGAVVYAIISVVESVLNVISVKCLQKVQHVQSAGQLPQAASERSKTTAGISRLWTNLLLASINIETLSPSNDVHRSIFEGLAYLVLQHTGTCLAILVHGRNTDDAGKPISVIHEVSEEVEHLAFKEKSIHLGALVDRVASLAPKYLSPPDGPRLARSKSVRNKTMAHRRTEGGLVDMHPLVKTKLQKTLTSFMGSINDEHDEFLDCLKMPRRVLLKEPSRIAKAEKQRMKDETVEWFVEKVWSVVGWDILRQEED